MINPAFKELLKNNAFKNVVINSLIQAAFETAKDEIECDVRNGVVPSDVKGFSELHDHVDANLYGGMALILSLFAEDDGPGDDQEIFNVYTELVDLWIKGGGVKGIEQKGAKS